ncbi:MAG: DUF2235 domain-containing protein, partial [Planctomycetes bacterium]|nr:DUF2235 domain-containing protein [Planctomycetota bacterium]
YHPSALERRPNPPITQAPYHRARKLAVGDAVTIPVYADQHWNATELYLEEGAGYEFSSTGEWLDHTIACGPAGAADGHFQLGELVHMAGTFLGKLEGVFKKVTGNQDADFILTRRLESAPWFSLVGVIANDGLKGSASPPPDGSPTPHQFLKIGAGPHPVTVKKPGYLFAFANDAWFKYDNNHGSVQMKVRRTS